jgi:hypothetical protein
LASLKAKICRIEIMLKQLGSQNNITLTKARMERAREARKNKRLGRKGMDKILRGHRGKSLAHSARGKHYVFPRKAPLHKSAPGP